MVRLSLSLLDVVWLWVGYGCVMRETHRMTIQDDKTKRQGYIVTRATNIPECCLGFFLLSEYFEHQLSHYYLEIRHAKKKEILESAIIKTFHPSTTE